MEKAMKKVMDTLIEELAEAGEKMESGDEYAYVCNDAIVIISMSEERHLSIKIIAGEPTYIDTHFGQL